MLTIRTVTSDNAELVDYYEKDEALIDAQERYYTDSGVISKIDEMTCAVWYGKGAAELGLSGHVSREDFITVSRGTKPGTNERIRGKKQKLEDMERHGHDNVFSAPKSVSIALEVGGDLRLFDAHMRAIKSTLDEVERMYANTRIWINGVRQVVNTGNLIIALIPHHTSRDGDPELHTHAYIMNGTMGPDGIWRSLSHEEMVHAKWVGSYYRQKLAEEAHAIGYRTYQTKDGFELVGYERHHIEVFSKRHKAIEQKVIQMGLDLTPENKKKAVLTTRKAKSDSGQKLEDIQQAWREEGKPYGIGTLPLQEPITFQVEPGLMKRELDSAIAHLSERKAAFYQREIFQYVFDHIKLSKVNAKDLEAEIQQHNSLIKTAFPGQYTTVEALEREIESHKLWMAGQGKAQPLKHDATLEGSSLNPGQAEAVLRTLTSTDTHQIWHGFSGVGKTTAFKALKAELEGTAVVIRGYATTIPAAEGLAQELGIKTNTVQHLVLNQPDTVPNQLWLVDEVGMLGAEDMLKMQRQAEAVGARIVLAGDAGQNSSIKAGSPLRSLMRYGATTHHLNQIIRQKDSIQLQAVELIANGNGSAALKLLNDNGYINEIQDRAQRANAIATQFLALSQREQNKTLIVTGTNAERLSITHALRQGLKEQGKLSESVKSVQLVSRQFTAEQSRRIENYSPGDYIQLRMNYAGTALQKGQLYKVEKRDGNELLLSSFGGRIYRLDPARHKEKDVFYAKNIQIAVGDKLRWTATDKSKGRTNGRHLTVTAINDTSMTVQDVNTKKTQEVSLLEPLPLDYDWVSTSYRAQGRTVKRVIVSTTSDPTASREPFYVKISRQEQELSVYTQDLQKLKDWVQQSNQQDNPLELIGDFYVSPEQRRERNETATGRDTKNPFEQGSLRQARQGIDGGIARTHGGEDQSTAQASRGQEPNLTGRGTLGGDAQGATRGSSIGLGESRHSDRHARASNFLDRRNPSLAEIAESIVQLRIQQELAQPLAQLLSSLEELQEMKRLLQAKNDLIAEKKATITAFFQEQFAQTKLEVVDTVLTQWQSLREEADPIQLVPEDIAIAPDTLAPDQVAELTELLQNYPAQKAIEFAMEDLYQTSEQVIDMQATLKTGIPVFRVDDLSDFSNGLIEDTMPTPTVEKPEPKPKTDQQSTPPAQSTKPKPTKATSSSPGSRAKPKTETQNPVFWQPLYPARVPTHIQPHHWDEFKRSAIHPAIIELNAESVSAQEVYERLLSEKLATMGTGQYVTQPMARLMAQYEQVAQGGWWGKAGIDAMSLLNLQPGQQPQLSTWGCFKADTPRLDQDKTDRKGQDEFIKYENPLGLPRSLYLPIVPDTLAERIYKKHGIDPTTAEKQSGFWPIVRQYNLPITITEGVKKTWASLSQGEITIGVSGVNGLYRSKDDDDNLLPNRQLDDQMAVFATPGREFRFAFDQDTKASTARNVRRDMVRGIELLEAQGCTCKVVNWKPNHGKGLDDLIAKRGPLAYSQAIAAARSSDKDKRTHYRTEYNAISRQVRLNYPQATPEFLDAEVYLRAIAKAELKDGDRFIREGDHARSLTEPEQVTAYVEHIIANAPLIRKQYQQTLAEQAAAEAQRVQDRAEYLAIAQQLRTELGVIPQRQLDIELYLREQNNPKIDRLLAQSDQIAISDSPDQAQVYVESIKAEAPQYQLQKELEAQRLQDRAEYVTLAERIRQNPAQLSSEQVDMQVYLIAELEGTPGDGDRLITQSDHALSLVNEGEVLDYLEYIKTEAPLYVQRVTDEAARTVKRFTYEDLVAQVQQQNTNIPTAHIDLEVYLIAQAKGLDAEAILAQSDHALSLNNEGEVQDYIEHISLTAPPYKQQLEADKAQADARLAQHRGIYQAIVQGARENDPSFPIETIDKFVWLSAQQFGVEPEQLLAHSERVRSNPQQAQAYIEQIKHDASQHLQEKEQAAARLEQDKNTYQAIAHQIARLHNPLATESLDMLVALTAIDLNLEPQPLLAHSPQVRSNPQQAQAYIDGIMAIASQVKQPIRLETAIQQQSPAQQPQPKPEETKPTPTREISTQKVKPIRDRTTAQQIKIKADKAIAAVKQKLRTEYDSYAQQITQEMGNVPPEVLDMEVYLRAGRSDHAKRLIGVGDTMTALRKDNSDFDGFYCNAIARVAPAYEALKNDPDAKFNLKMMAAIVRNTNATLLVESRPQPTIHRKKEREDELML